MVMPATTEPELRELDGRANDGFDVRLLWSPRTNRLFVTVEDQRGGDWFTLEVDAADALEAFHHPFAYRRATSVVTIASGGAPSRT
jgi:hypothetical protein